ncbi:MAG: hypothetical protein AB8U93_03805 [Francisella endosymbiont of Hyalomma scupense]
MDLNYYRRGREVVFQLYLYPDDNSLDSNRATNLDMTIVKDIEKSSGLKPVAKPYPADKSARLSKREYFPSSVKGVGCGVGHGSISKN